MSDNIAKLKEWVDGSDNIVFFGGAGVSTESNIPDFRSVDGLYNQEYDYPPETILSHTFFTQKPEVLLNEEGEPIESAPHPQQILQIKMEQPVAEKYILRKRKK